MQRMILFLLLPVLAACSTPRESCLRTATQQLGVVNRLVAETEANLARGYAVEREPYTTTRVDLCVGGSRYRYGGVGWSYCTVPTTRYRARPVAIDRATEQRKLRELKQTRTRLAREAEPRVDYCNQRYPAS